MKNMKQGKRVCVCVCEWVIRLLQLKLVIRKLILSVNNKKSGRKNKVLLRCGAAAF